MLKLTSIFNLIFLILLFLKPFEITAVTPLSVTEVKYKNWYLRRALLAIISGMLITLLHLAVIVAIAIGRSQ